MAAAAIEPTPEPRAIELAPPQQSSAEPAAASEAANDGDDEDAPAPSSTRELEPIVDPDHLLVAIAHETPIFQRPNFKSQKIGYLRAVGA